ncbi:MAG: hypothetical protein OZ928_16570 [Polyangiaceae bacterium]|nr:hypothetical protein [Polyangiaceae bacterium]
MRSLTPVEAAAAVAVLGSLLAAGVPAFVKNLHASRLVEPIDGLERIATRATALAAGRAAELAYPESVGLTPAEVPRGVRVTDPPGTWDHPTWRELGFSFSAPHAFSFAFESENAAGHASFRALAHGDLDGDGVLSTFQISGQTRDGAEPTVEPMEMDREVE